MDTEELIEHCSKDLTEIAKQALNEVIAERSVTPGQQKQITEQIVIEKRTAIEPYGVRGWLALLVLSMMFLGPLMSGSQINMGFSVSESQYPELTSVSEWQTYKITTWITFWIAAAASFRGGLGLLRGRSWSDVKFAKQILWVAGPVASIVLGALSIFIFGKIDSGFIGSLVASVISASVWTTYLSKSKRVRNTYEK